MSLDAGQSGDVVEQGEGVDNPVNGQCEIVGHRVLLGQASVDLGGAGIRRELGFLDSPRVLRSAPPLRR